MWPVNNFSIRANDGGHDKVHNCCKHDHDEHLCPPAPLPPPRSVKSPHPQTPSLAMLWLMQLVASLSRQSHRFNLRPVNVGFFVDQVALGQTLLLNISVLRCHSISATYSFISSHGHCWAEVFWQYLAQKCADMHSSVHILFAFEIVTGAALCNE